MFSSQVISGISGGVLGIVGLLLVLSAIRQRRVNWRIGLGASLFGLGLFILVTELPQYALGFSILATLAMAFAALFNIQQSADRENRDRRDRILNEIIKWAEDVAKCGLEMESALLLATPDKGYAKIKQMALTFSALFRESRRITNIVLPSWDKLHETIEELREQLPEQKKYLEAYMANKCTFKTVEDHRATINGIADKVIVEACNILKRDID